MTILIDIDSTITNFGKTLLAYLNDEAVDTGSPQYQYSDITSYD